MGKRERERETIVDVEKGRERKRERVRKEERTRLEEMHFLGRVSVVFRVTDAGPLVSAIGEKERERAWAAADVEQPSRPVEPQLPAEDEGDLRRVGKTALHVVPSASFVQASI